MNLITTQTLYFEVAGLQLHGTLVAVKNSHHGLLRISGGAPLPHTGNTWQQRLAEAGISSFAFDYRGVGDSEGVMAETTLNTRVEDAEKALETFLEQSGLAPEQIVLMGASMGGPIAIRVAKAHAIGGLILAVPAAYSAEARDKYFGEAFTQAIRKENSWIGSPDFDDLEKVQARRMLVYGLHDTVIPQGVIEEYRHTLGEEGKVVAVDATHTFMREQSEEKEANAQMWEEIIRWITRK